jgi:hypothetical protein
MNAKENRLGFRFPFETAVYLNIFNIYTDIYKLVPVYLYIYIYMYKCIDIDIDIYRYR